MDLPGGVQSVESRHGNVEKGQVWTEVASKLDGLTSVGGFPDHFEFVRIEQGFDALSKDGVVVCEEEARHVQAEPRGPCSLSVGAL